MTVNRKLLAITSYPSRIRWLTKLSKILKSSSIASSTENNLIWRRLNHWTRRSGFWKTRAKSIKRFRGKIKTIMLQNTKMSRENTISQRRLATTKKSSGSILIRSSIHQEWWSWRQQQSKKKSWYLPQTSCKKTSAALNTGTQRSTRHECKRYKGRTNKN